MDQFLCMAFAQLAYRESLRDIECCLRAHPAKLYHMGIRGKVSKSTLAHANERRDWRIWADLAQVLIGAARELYHNDELGVELSHTAYAFDSTTIDLCLSLFPWASFRKTKAAVKAHTLLDLRGNVPCWVHVTSASVHDVNALDLLPVEAGSFYILDRGYLDFARLYVMTRHAAFFVTRIKSNTRYRRLYSWPVNKSTGLRCDQTIVLSGFYSLQGLPRQTAPGSFCRSRYGKTTAFLDQQPCGPSSHHSTTLPLPLAGRTVLSLDKAAPADQILLRNERKRGQDADLHSGERLRSGRHRQETPAPGRYLALHNSTDFERIAVREKAHSTGSLASILHNPGGDVRQPVGIIHPLIGQSWLDK